MQIIKTNKKDELKSFAQMDRPILFDKLRTGFTGLSTAKAQVRLEEYGSNVVSNGKATPWYFILFRAIRNPFVLILTFLAIISYVTTNDGDYRSVYYMCVMIIVSVTVNFVQNYKSQKASIALKEMIENTTNVKRDGLYQEIPMDEVVPGDIIKLQTGDMIPADAILLSSKDLFINQASLTGESFPVEKRLPRDLEEAGGVDWQNTSALDAPNVLFMGTDVVSGNGEILIVKTGNTTMFGGIAQKASGTRVKTAFDIGLNRVSRVLMVMVFVMFGLVFFIDWGAKEGAMSAFLYAVSVAVGLTPEMLPVIVNTNLAKGALTLSKEKVIVKQLGDIQNLGSMDILCTDKTGTITEDRVVMIDYFNSEGAKADEVLDAVFINSNFQTGWKNLMDVAVIDYFKKAGRHLSYPDIVKVDEIPFDFTRRVLSVVVKFGGQNLLVTKGAVEEMQKLCTHVIGDGQAVQITDEKLAKMQAINMEMNRKGMRVLTVAQRILTDEELENFDKSSECGMTLLGFVGFLDPAKESAKEAVNSLQNHGVSVKVLTGDNAIVAQKVCEDVGIRAENYLLGSDIDKLTDDELFHAAMRVNLFAKLAPMQKARIIEQLRKSHTVGFMGDGINDAPALRTADVGISVDTAADVTKEASSIILLEKSLKVLETGVMEGRKVFTNMMKYVRITLSSNFGNVFSQLAACLFLPFDPMLAIQLLTLNFIYDMSQLTVSWDNVDLEEIKRPVKWETRGLKNFAILIGPISSIFDIATFLMLWYFFKYNDVSHAAFFQAGWFAESLGTQALAFYILRTKKVPFLQSNASIPVLCATLTSFAIGALLIFTPAGKAVNMAHVVPTFWLWWIIMIISYLLLLQVGKNIYYRVLAKRQQDRLPIDVLMESRDKV